MTLTPGMKLGVYDVVASIGSGGMGEVYRGRDSMLQRDVALSYLVWQEADGSRSAASS